MAEKPPVIRDLTDEEEARLQRDIADDPDTWEARGALVRRTPPRGWTGLPAADAVALTIDRSVADALRKNDPDRWEERANAILKEAVGL